MWDGALAFLVAAQTEINKSITADINAFVSSRDWRLLLSVLPFSIAFGAIHALTPGHSKTVLASYVAGSPLTVLRGAGVAAILSATHIAAAVLIAVLALPLITVTLGGAGRAPFLEDLSRAILAGIGVWMLLRAWRRSSHHHTNGIVAGIAAGLIPCPLTLFVMFFAMSRGVPEAGIVFAVAIMLGVMLTLSCVAILAIFVRAGIAGVLARAGSRIDRASRIFEGTAGLLLVLIGIRELFFH